MAEPARASRVSIFWDGSNIFVPARDVAIDREGPYHAGGIRIQVDKMFDLACARRQVERAVDVSSIDPKHAVLDMLRDCGIEVEVFEVGERSGREQAVDQALQVHMLRCLADHDPHVAVLLTGDGAGVDDGRGYFADLKRMHAAGWTIEVLTWKAACHRGMRKWVEAHGRLIFLDDYYDSVTFLEGARRSKALPYHAFRRSAPVAPAQAKSALEGSDASASHVHTPPALPADPAPTPASIATPDESASTKASPAFEPPREVLPVAISVPVASERSTRSRYKARTTARAAQKATKARPVHDTPTTEHAATAIPAPVVQPAPPSAAVAPMPHARSARSRSRAVALGVIVLSAAVASLISRYH